MNKEIPTSVPGRPAGVTDDGRTAVDWDCPHCGGKNRDAGYYPSGGFGCADCGTMTRVDIPQRDA